MDRAGLVRAIFDEGWNAVRFDVVAPALSAFQFHIGGKSRALDVTELRRDSRPGTLPSPTCASMCML